MPRDGSTLWPSLSDLKITSNMRRDVARCGSSCIPPKSGLKNRLIILVEKPNARSATSVDTSWPLRRTADLRRKTRARSTTIRALSNTLPIGAKAVVASVCGLRNGSETAWPFPLRQTSAPGSNGRRSSARMSTCDCSSG